MKFRLIALVGLLFPMVLAAGSACAQTGAAPTTPAIRSTQTGRWSPEVKGLHGRFIATPGAATDGKGRQQLRLELELENSGKTPVDLLWDDNLGSMMKLSLEDESGAALPVMAVGGNFAAPPPHWVTIKPGATLRTTLSPAAYEYVPSGTTLFRPLTFQAWNVTPGAKRLFVSETFSPVTSTSTEPARAGAWTGSLMIPRVLLP
jgi:hypothetical protein